MDPGTVATTGHPACTAAVGTNPDRVLDPQLRVRWRRGPARGRRLGAPRANANAPAIMIGERCADFMLSACG